MNSTSEYLSPDFHGSTEQIFVWLTLIMIAALALGRTRPALPWLLAVLAIINLALFARRNIPLMALLAPALVALDRDADWRRLPSFTRAASLPETAHELLSAGRPCLLPF